MRYFLAISCFETAQWTHCSPVRMPGSHSRTRLCWRRLGPTSAAAAVSRLREAAGAGGRRKRAGGKRRKEGWLPGRASEPGGPGCCSAPHKLPSPAGAAQIWTSRVPAESGRLNYFWSRILNVVVKLSEASSSQRVSLTNRRNRTSVKEYSKCLAILSRPETAGSYSFK